MDYKIKAHPTLYNGTLFRSRLEARWAAFFDLNKWEWAYEPIDLEGWVPDFLLTLPCGHSECEKYHRLYVEVKPYHYLEQFNDHQMRKFSAYEDPSPAAFGLTPYITYWEISHGHGGGGFHIASWVDGDIRNLWEKAGNMTRYKP